MNAVLWDAGIMRGDNRVPLAFRALTHIELVREMCLGCATAEAEIAQAFGGRRFENKRGVRDQMKAKYALLAGMFLLGTIRAEAAPS
jgi:hypothetical protein